MMNEVKTILKQYSVVIIMTILTLLSLITGIIILTTFKSLEGNGFMLIKIFGFNQILYGESIALQAAVIFLLVLTPLFGILALSWFIFLLIVKK